MPNRVLRDWTESEKMNELSANAETLFTRLMMKADDFGNFNANPRLVKSLCYPLKDYREADISRWIQELETSGLIALYDADNKKYLHILNFGQRLRIMKPKYPNYTENQHDKNELEQSADTCPQSAVICTPETKRNEVETNIDTKVSPPPDGEVPQKDSTYNSIPKTKEGIWTYLKTKPTEIEPYIDFWNLFAAEKKIPRVGAINKERRRKFAVRIREKPFDFCRILKVAGESEFLLTSGWFGFDWLIKNDTNYLKILEGNYQKSKNIPDPKPTGEPKRKTAAELLKEQGY